MEMHLDMRYARALLLILVICIAGCGGGGSDHVGVGATPPDQGATGVPTNTLITAIFDEALDVNSVNDTTFLVNQGGVPVAGAVTAAGKTAIFTPSVELLPNTGYVVTLTTGVTDQDGDRLSSNEVWTFTTGAGPVSQTVVDLATAAGFVVLGGNSVSNTGTTALTGNLGVSPGTMLTGFPPGTLTGTEHVGDAVAAQGQTDMQTAYETTKALTAGAIQVTGDVGGLKLPPGLYRSTSSLSIASADLTLDARGDVNAVFIFQISDSLTIAPGRQVTLTNGAQAGNVFWLVCDSANLEANSVFVGAILANKSITLGNGATLTGRALAHTNDVVMDTNTLTEP